MEDRQDEVIEKIKKAMRLARKAGSDGERAAAEAAAKNRAALILGRMNPDGAVNKEGGK